MLGLPHDILVLVQQHALRIHSVQVQLICAAVSLQQLHLQP